MCGRTCACACEIHSGKCAKCACVRPFFRRAMCDHTFAHFLGLNCQKMLLFVLKTRMSYSILEHPFLFWIILFCFRTSYSVLNTLNHSANRKIAEKGLKNDEKKNWKIAENFILPEVWVRVRSATTSNWVCAHVCVRTLIWTCEVRACDPKNGHNSRLDDLMKKVFHWLLT